MSNSIVSPTNRQVNTLTKNQRALIDRLMERCPHISPADVHHSYEHYCYARNWHVFIAETPDLYRHLTIVTRCDHDRTAKEKVLAIRAYIASKRGGGL